WNPYDPATPKKTVSLTHLTLPQAVASSTSSVAPPSSVLIATPHQCLTHSETLTTPSASESQQADLKRWLNNLQVPSSSNNLLSSKKCVEIFSDLQRFLNNEYNRLGQKFTKTPEQLSEFMQQYHKLVMFCDEVITFTLFSPDQIKKLRCYQVSMLIGSANVCGIKRDNVVKIKILERALDIIRIIEKDVVNPYGNGLDFNVTRMRDICLTMRNQTGNYLAQSQR
ncbi:MAG: hypothetical protein Q8R43_02265, partial [Alphaproteobacteria bacterium]|nr:hypothetical protein [Alphaproteobacteria bacterium]